MLIVHISLPPEYIEIKEVKRKGILYINDNYKGGDEKVKIIPYPSF